MPDVMAADAPEQDAGSCEPESLKDGGVDNKTWKKPRLRPSSVVVVVAIFVLVMMTLLLWHGVFPMPSRTI